MLVVYIVWDVVDKICILYIYITLILVDVWWIFCRTCTRWRRERCLSAAAAKNDEHNPECWLCAEPPVGVFECRKGVDVWVSWVAEEPPPCMCVVHSCPHCQWSSPQQQYCCLLVSL